MAYNPLLKPKREVGDNFDNSTLHLKIDITQLHGCNYDISCGNGYACFDFESNGRGYCYIDGRLEEVVGCRVGQLTIFNSYPALLYCFL